MGKARAVRSRFAQSREMEEMAAGALEVEKRLKRWIAVQLAGQSVASPFFRPFREQGGRQAE